MGEKPTIAFLLILLGGIATLLGSANVFLNNTNGTVGGMLGTFAAIFLLVSAAFIYSDDVMRVRQGSSFALLAAFIATAAFYYVYIGFALAIVGSLLGLTFRDNTQHKDLFLFILMGGIGIFMGSILLIGQSHVLQIVETGFLGALLGVVIIRYSTKIYGSSLAVIQQVSMVTLFVGVISLIVDVLVMSYSVRAVLPIGATIGTILVITGSYAGVVRPNFIASTTRSKGRKSAARRRR